MADAARMFGTFRQGKATHPSTPTRWCVKGFKLPNGETLKLEHIRVCGRLMTSRAAVLRFLERMQEPADDTIPATRSPAERRRAAEAAGRELEKLGA
ncbi:MAG: DUF1580 domain-containing protein [Planctomycetia bacterium]|nr:DUF1580 domain-containing protein [Planctomycetia bacterium]